VTAAPDIAAALAYFSALKQLHVASWTRRGRPHAFRYPFFETFHRDLIATAYSSGAIELLKIEAGAQVLGYLYNFRHAGTVYAYQSGFAPLESHVRPGYVCHMLAIDSHARAGEACYDFMAGRNRLKESFADESYAMVSHRFRRPDLGYRIENLARKLLRRT
jgi:CelD/BcsL family acetyltransferase involved in cellulose biosynthesis